MAATRDELFSVEGQVVLVSGGSRGIGRAIAAGFAERGARVVITGREAATLEKTAGEIAPPGGDVRPIACDVSDTAALRALAERVVAEFGRVDTLVNVAGVNRRRRVEDLTEEDYDFILDINLKGAFMLSTAVGRHMLERGGGNQINIASLTTLHPLPCSAAYAVSKAGLGQMTRALALEWGPRGVRVNAIAPGFFATDLTRPLRDEPNMLAWMKSNTPFRRVGTPEELVGAAIFLASPAAGFVTGHILYVDGGFTAGWNWPIALP